MWTIKLRILNVYCVDIGLQKTTHTDRANTKDYKLQAAGYNKAVQSKSRINMSIKIDKTLISVEMNYKQICPNEPRK